MGTAQNFFNATPAPDPQQNPMMAGIAGGLQGLSNYGDYQKQMQMMQYQNNQKQMTDAIQAGVQNHQAGFGQGPEGSTPLQIGGQQGYWDQNGMGPAGTMDMAKAKLYETMQQNKQGSGSPEAVAAYHGGLEILKAMAAQSVDPKTGQSKFDIYKNLDGLHDYINKNFNSQDDSGEQSGDQLPQPWQPGQAKSEGQAATPSAAMQMFNKGTVNPANGQQTGSTATPRAQANAKTVQANIEKMRQGGKKPNEIKALLKQHGYNPSDYQV